MVCYNEFYKVRPWDSCPNCRNIIRGQGVGKSGAGRLLAMGKGKHTGAKGAHQGSGKGSHMHKGKDKGAKGARRGKGKGSGNYKGKGASELHKGK